MEEQMVPQAEPPRPAHAAEYAALLDAVQSALASAPAKGERLFRTDAANLYDLFLQALPADRRRHDCAACRRFVGMFGTLVTVAADGTTRSAAWHPAAVPDFYRPAIAALAHAVAQARIRGLHLSDQPVWGTPSRGAYAHLSCTRPAETLFRRVLLSPHQAMAARAHDRRTLARALDEYKPALLDQALRLLRTDALSRSERFVGPVQWLRQLHDQLRAARTPRHRDALLWRAAAAAPPGFCTPRASVVGALLDDLAAARPFAEVKGRFDAKLHPLRYQRPQALPEPGNIAQAEAAVAALGLAPALERRFARLDELQPTWRPAPDPAPAPITTPAASVFAHLPRRQDGTPPNDDAPLMVSTWDKFARTVLPRADAMQLHVPDPGNFIALTTAVHPDAPPLLKWDRPEARNPVSWYVYPGRSPAAQWRLQPGTWCRVDAAVPLPTLWGANPMTFLGEGIVLVLHGAADTGHSGNALFPEHLRTELHGVRRTIEAYSRAAALSGLEHASACGLDLRRGTAALDCILRARLPEGWTTFLIDRWD